MNRIIDRLVYDLIIASIVGIWKNKEWAQPSNDRKGFDQVYPEGTFFTWWGCIDSVIVNGKAQYNPIRTSVMPNFTKVAFLLNDSSVKCCKESIFEYIIEDGLGAHI